MYNHNIKKRLKRGWQLYLLILPAITYIFIFGYLPMYGIIIAFKNFRPSLGILGSEWVGLDNFIKFIKYPNFWRIVMNTLRIGIYSLCTFPCAIIFAIMLNELQNKKFKKSIQMVSYMPHFLSTVVICSMLTLFLNEDTGMINKVLELFGVSPKEYLSIPNYFEDIYVWSAVWQDIGWGSIIYLAALAGVPNELIDAARVDGAGRLRIIWHINIPWIMPTIVTLLILRCGGIMNVGFEKAYLLQNALNLSRSSLISTYVYEIGIRGAQFSYSAAIGLFNTVVNFILLILVNIISKKMSEISVL